MLVRRNLVPTLWTVSLGLLLCSCASTAPADLDKAVRVYNVYRIGGEVLPRKVEGCEYVDVVVASTLNPDEAKGVTLSDPKVLLETVRVRAHGKGADTAFVSIAAPIVKIRTARWVRSSLKQQYPTNTGFARPSFAAVTPLVPW